MTLANLVRLSLALILVAAGLSLFSACSGDDFEAKLLEVERGLAIRDAGLDPLDPQPLTRPVAWVDARDADSVVVNFVFVDEEIGRESDPATRTVALVVTSGTEDPAGFVRWEAELPPRAAQEALEYWFEARDSENAASWPPGAPDVRSRVEASPLIVDFDWPDWPAPVFEWPERGDPNRILDGAEDQGTLIVSPAFEVIRDPIWTPRNQATVLANSAGVRNGIGIEVDGQAWFLPLAVLLWNEVANVTLGDIRSGVSYCPLTDTILHFDSRFDPNALPKWRNYAPAGLFNSNLSVGIEGLRSGDATVFNQMNGIGFAGPEKGKRLQPRPAVLVPIDIWHRLHPNTLVLEGDPETVDEFDYIRRDNPYAQYWRNEEIRFPVARTDDRMPAKRRVFGLLFPDDPVVLPLEPNRDFVHHTSAGGIDVVILHTSSLAIALHARHPVTGAPMRLTRSRVTWRETPLFEDDSEEPGLWTLEGVALSGPAKGMRLGWVPSMSAFWFAWYAMYPEARFELPEFATVRREG